MLDYVLGDRGQPADAFGDDVAEKYVAARAEFLIDGSTILLERSWRRHGERQRVAVNGLSIPDAEFSEAWLEILRIPSINYPQGDPLRDLIWRELSWRSLWHQMYRKQTMWTDIADKQPESEQFACLLSFLGQARHLFAPEIGKVVELLDQKKEIEAKKQQIIAFLQQTVRDVLGAQVDGSDTFSVDAIDHFVTETALRIKHLEGRREEALRGAGAASDSSRGGETIAAMSVRAAALAGSVTALDAAVEETDKRVRELAEHDELLSMEVRRLKRSRVAGELFADLRVTNCPACDQSVENRHLPTGRCHVCTQTISEPVALETAVRRVEFEVEQIESERAEVAELVVTLRGDSRNLRDQRGAASNALREITDTLATLSVPITAALHVNVSAIDVEIGRLQERVVQVERLRDLVTRRDDLTARLDQMAAQISALEAQIAKTRTSLSLESASDVFSDSMMDYLNVLNRSRRDRWTQGQVGLDLRLRGFAFTVSGSRWQRRLGGSLTLYFLLAYHFALLRLSGQPDRHYPGFAVLDLPATLEDGANVKDKENYILDPFSASMKKGKLRGCQLIAAGSTFEDLKDAHRIELTTVWRPRSRARTVSDPKGELRNG